MMTLPPQSSISKTTYVLWAIAGIALFLFITTIGSRIFYGTLVPQAAGIGQLGVVAVLGFAFVAGIVAFFAPCPFAVFPAYIAYFLNTEENHQAQRTGRNLAHAFYTGIVVSLGIFVFYLVTGIILALFGTALASYVNWLKLAIVPIFFIAGWMLLAGKSFGTKQLNALSARVGTYAKGGRHATNMFLYGVVYGIAAAACHLPILIVLALIPILAGSFWIGLATFVMYALGASLLLIIFTVLANYKRSWLISNLGLHGERVKKAAGSIFILTGIYLISFYILYGM